MNLPRQADRILACRSINPSAIHHKNKKNYEYVKQFTYILRTPSHKHTHTLSFVGIPQNKSKHQITTKMHSSILRPLIGLLLLLSCTSEAFSRAQVNRGGQVVSVHPPKPSTTALQQASLAPPLDDSPESLLDNIRSKLLPTVRARGGANGVSAAANAGNGSFLQKHPFLSAVMITTVNSVAADLLTQRFQGMVWNPKRSLLFAAFGFLYQGCAQYAIVNLGWERLFPGTKPKAVIAKICGMNLLSDPLLFMPTFYIFKETMTTGHLGWATIKAALMAYQANCLFDWRNSWMVWFPGHAVTYGIMPTHQRIPWMAFLSFFYMCILSITRG
jgi:hypothetical protein